jgi:NTE family protein
MKTNGGLSSLPGFNQFCRIHSGEFIFVFLVLWMILVNMLTGSTLFAEPSYYHCHTTSTEPGSVTSPPIVNPVPDHSIFVSPYHATAFGPDHASSIDPGHSSSSNSWHAISFSPDHAISTDSRHAVSFSPDHAISTDSRHAVSFSPDHAISTDSRHAVSFSPDYLSLPDPGTGSIGLTLSGGGAKGFAHIGVLHVIDSLGVKIHYISGTSIGAVVGAMYAAGYSAKEIEEIAMSVDWRAAFGMKPDLDYVHIYNRRGSGRSIVEFPLKKTGIQFRSGFIRGQQLWSLLEKIFFHVRGTEDFNDFPIPFACVATNIETGEEVVLNNGDIVSALRASMAMPAIFEPVTRDEMVLFDGGMVNNFPVDVVKEMGAGYVIGVYVSDGLRSAGELQTPVAVAYQMGFIRDALKFHINKDQADIFLEPDLENFTAASFADIGEIIEEGRQSARHISASLDSIAKSVQGTRAENFREAGRKENIVVDSVFFRGLENVRLSYINNIAGIQPEDTVNADKVHSLINSFYATDYFERVTYSFVPSPYEPERVNLIFSFSEKSLARISGAIHYNSFSGVGIIGGISATSFLFRNMDAGFRVRIGELPAFRTGIRIFTGSAHRAWINIIGHGEMIDLPLYRNFESAGEYKHRHLRMESSINRLTGPNSFFTAGTSIYADRIEPEILTGFDFNGSEQGFEAFARWNKYSLDHHSFSRTGQNITAEVLYYFGRDYSMNVFSENGNTAGVPYPDTAGDNFFRIKFNWESFIPVNPGLTYFTQIQGGYNYPSSQGILNIFNMGGDQNILRNQLTFSGLNEFGIVTSSAVAVAAGFNYNMMSDFYLTPALNAGMYDFRLNRLKELSNNRFVLGAGLGVGYLSLIGPIKVSFSYSPQAGSLISSVNVGWSF